MSALAAGDATLKPHGALRLLSSEGGRASFRVRLGEGPAVVKIAPASAGDKDLRRVLARLPPTVAPRLLAQTEYEGARVLVVEHVPGSVLTRRRFEALDDNTLAGMATAMARVHARAAPKRRSALPCDGQALFQECKKLLSALGGRLDTRRRAHAQRHLGRVRRELTARYRRGVPAPRMRLVHGDLRFENVVVAESAVRLIDFEHAAAGDPALDLALFAEREPLSRFDELRVLDAYAAASKDRSLLARYFALRAPLSLLHALVAFKLGDSTALDNALERAA